MTQYRHSIEKHRFIFSLLYIGNRIKLGRQERELRDFRMELVRRSLKARSSESGSALVEVSLL